MAGAAYSEGLLRDILKIEEASKQTGIHILVDLLLDLNPKVTKYSVPMEN